MMELIIFNCKIELYIYNCYMNVSINFYIYVCFFLLVSTYLSIYLSRVRTPLKLFYYRIIIIIIIIIYNLYTKASTKDQRGRIYL